MRTSILTLVYVCTNVQGFVQPDSLGLRPPICSLNKSKSCLYNTNSDQSIQQSNNKKLEQRAGTSGYSILRQPLSWNSEEDPKFNPPTKLDEEEENRQKNDISSWWGNPNIENGKSTNDVENKNTVKQAKLSHRKEEDEQTLDLFQRTLDTLDYPYILKALSSLCTTIPAQDLIQEQISLSSRNPKSKKDRKTSSDDNDILTMPLTAQSVEGVHHRYNALKELSFIMTNGKDITITSKVKNNSNASGKKRSILPPNLDKGGIMFDLKPIFDIAESGQVLEGPEILEISTTLEILKEIEEWTNDLLLYNEQQQQQQQQQQNEYKNKDTIEKFLEIPKLTNTLEISDPLLELLTTAFDKGGSLSSSTFPQIGALRSQIRTLKRDILTTLDDIITSPAMQDKIAVESGGSLYSEINGRIVIPVDEKYKNSAGIMHDSSRSGKTVFVEPTEIVGPTNELRQLEMELKREEGRVWRELTEKIMEERESIEMGVAVVAQIDLIMARMRLGQKLADYAGGVVIPEVKDEGVMHLHDAKHPVLLLRELDNVVGSDIDLGANGNQGMILTGPNSGGKTVILKLLGLMAFMVRDGIPLPASRPKNTEDSPARVDFFDPVLADIGDMQSVDGDLSTFSGHMLVCREVLAGSGKNSLVLMDELGSGTDPSQGVAIAQALLEALLEKGTRVAITTHYLQLKQLASSDHRFTVAGMQFVNNRPTYKLLPGQIGESFALSVAERLNLPPAVISRANELLDEDTRQMGDLIKDLEAQKASMQAQVDEMERKKQEMEVIQQEMIEAKEKLLVEQLNARRDEAKKFATKLEEKERILEDILNRIKSDPSRKILATSWDDIRYVRRDALTEAENVPGRKLDSNKNDAPAELIPLAELRPLPQLNVGDTLVICKKGAMKGKEVKILQIRGRQVQVAVGKMPVQMKMTELALPIKQGFGNDSQITNGRGKDNLSKIARKALAEHEAMGGASGGYVAESETKPTSKAAIIRTDSNTIDLRGCTFEEGKRKCEDFFSRFVMQKHPVVFVLHGHGTGVLKKRLREWFKRDRDWVKTFKPADASDGGDAFTQVTLKKVKF